MLLHDVVYTNPENVDTSHKVISNFLLMCPELQLTKLHCHLDYSLRMWTNDYWFTEDYLFGVLHVFILMFDLI